MSKCKAFLKMAVNLPDSRRANMQQVRDETGAVLQYSRRGAWFPHFLSGMPLKIIILGGEADQVCAAFKKLYEMREVQNPNSSTTFHFVVPPSVATALIGPSGENIQRVQRETGVRVIVRPEFSETVVDITGDLQSVEHAVKWLVDVQQQEDTQKDVIDMVMRPSTADYQAFQSRNGRTRERPDEQTEIFMLVPDERLGLLFGKEGKNIERITRACGCLVQVDMKFQGMDGGKVVKIAGAMGDVQMAHRMIMMNVFDPKLD